MNGTSSTDRPDIGESVASWSMLRSGFARRATPVSAHVYCRTALRFFQLSAVSAAVLPACADRRAPEGPSAAARALPQHAATHADVPTVCVTARDREIDLGAVKRGSMSKLAFQVTNDRMIVALASELQEFPPRAPVLKSSCPPVYCVDAKPLAA